MPAQVKTKYQANDSNIYALSLSPDYAAVAGTEPTGDTSSRVKAKVSKTKREYGVRPRGVTLSRIIGTAPDTFVKYTFLPLRSSADASNAAYANGATITIGDIDWTVVSFQNEDY